MNKKVLAGLVAAIIAAVAGWYFVLRGGDKAPAAEPDTGSARSAVIAAGSATPEKRDLPPPDQAAPRGIAPRWSLDKDPEGPLPLEGQVLGPDGRGVGGAKVWLASVPPRETTSEDDGTFSFDKLVGRTYTLTASKDKLVGSATYKLVDKGDPVVIRISEGAGVDVTVIDDGGEPIAGATVASDEQHRATTNDKGKAKLEPVHPGWIRIEAQAPGYAPASSFLTIGSGGATGQLTITMHRGYAVSGKVVDEAGRPIAKAKVDASSGMWDLGGGDSDAVHTDDKGQFTFPALAPGQHTLTAVDGEHAPGRSSPISVKDAPVSGVVITMKAGARVAGKVVDKDKKPVPYATVRMKGKGANEWMVSARQATTDKDGAFELRGLVRVKHQARAESDLAASRIVEVDLDAKAEVTDLELVLDVSGTIAGIVVDDRGQPVPEVTVNAFPDIMGGASTEGLALAGLSSATTDGGGGFVIHGLPDGAYRLWASRQSAGFGEWGQHGTSAKTGDKAVKITLPAPGGLKGTIAIDGASEAPAMASVQVGQQPPTPAKAGVFEIKDVAAGTYDVTFRGPEFAELVKRDVKIEPGTVTDLGKVTVYKGRRLVGKVVDRSGNAVAGAKVKVGEMLFSAEGQEEQLEQFEEMGGVRSAVSDQAGEFTIIGIPKKATTAMADHPVRGRSMAVPVPEGADDPPRVTLALRGYGSVSGTVTSKGKPLPRVTVSVSTKGGGAAASFAQTDDDGHFTMARVPEGDQVLQAMQQQMMSMRSANVNVRVVAGKESKVTIDIPVGTLVLTVTVKALPNNQVDAAQVFLFNGIVAPANGKQLTDGFFQGGTQGMKFWLGGAMPMPKFEELVPGQYSACVIPITGSMSDPTFLQRIQENVATLKVYCKAVKVTPSPTEQAVVLEVPAMTPFPAPPPN
ncbi:MAG: carboxypeptidase regulatory-like domain-containing protein [Myxococcales bacterium]|nr:carboxypeptidase regulatory-like domain-containing protein [Myxococcales bacterium]